MDEELDKHEKKLDKYAQKEASIREVIDKTISKSTFPSSQKPALSAPHVG